MRPLLFFSLSLLPLMPKPRLKLIPTSCTEDMLDMPDGEDGLDTLDFHTVPMDMLPTHMEPPVLSQDGSRAHGDDQSVHFGRVGDHPSRARDHVHDDQSVPSLRVRGGHHVHVHDCVHCHARDGGSHSHVRVLCHDCSHVRVPGHVRVPCHGHVRRRVHLRVHGRVHGGGGGY